MPQRNALGRSIQSRNPEQKGKAVVINEEIVHAADGSENGDAKVASERPLKRRKSESANAKLLSERMKEPSRKKKG